MTPVLPAASIRIAALDDHAAVWAILEPVIRASETYAIDRGMSEAAALAWWFADDRATFVLEDNGVVLGTYYLRANQGGGGSHVANAGYMTAAHAAGRGVARRMCTDSLDRASAQSFRAMQFNFVVASNVRAIALWQSMQFVVVGRLPRAFAHPTLGLVDALVLHRDL